MDKVTINTVKQMNPSRRTDLVQDIAWEGFSSLLHDDATLQTSRRAADVSVIVDFTVYGIETALSKSKLNSALRKQGLREVESMSICAYAGVLTHSRAYVSLKQSQAQAQA